MFLVSNREVHPARKTPAAFGPKINPAGPNELRLAEAVRKNGKWRVDVLPDVITATMAAEVGLPPPTDATPVYASAYVAQRLLARVNPKLIKQPGEGRNLVLFVHGFNNDLEAVLDRAESFEKNFGVEVLVFTWPANGGGVKGVASYRSDKRDARASTGALDRVLAKLADFLREIHAAHEKRVEALADERHGDDAAAWDRFFTEQAQKWCPFAVSLVLHSMGNYLFKTLLGSSVYRAQNLLFDNIILAAADTNSEGHAEWVQAIPARKRIYITINEDDFALRASRLKMGELQKARLGHYRYNLNATNATYVDFSRADKVGSSHAYFGDEALDNPSVRRFFDDAFNGRAAEAALPYDVASNTYVVP